MMQQSTRDRYPSEGRAHTRVESHALPLALGVVLLVFLVALGSSRSLYHVGGPGDLTQEQLVVSDLIALLIYVAVLPAMLYMLWQILDEFREKGGRLASASTKREKGVITLALTLAVMVAGMLAILAFVHPRGAKPPTSPSRQTTSIVPHPSPRSGRAFGDLTLWVVAGGGGAFLVVVFARALFQRRRRDLAAQGMTEYELESPRRELHEQVRISIADIERESDPRRAVIRAYAGMESTLAGHDLGRRPFEAPGEYLGRAFSALRLSRRPGERLTNLFEQARFSTHAIGPEMKRESIAALGELRNELEAKLR